MNAEPLAPHQLQAVLDDFDRDGYAMVRQLLEPDEVKAIRDIADRCLDDPEGAGRGFVEPVYGAPVLRNTQSLDPLFCHVLIREPFLSIAEAVLGPEVGFCGQNVIRSGKDEAISIWHIDDVLEFPLPDGVDHHPEHVRMPVFWFSFQIALSDIDSPEDGATEVVPGSHRSGRFPPRNREAPDESDPPTWNGRRPAPILCKAGDVFLFNHQLWHRGGPNRSGRTRYLMQNQYCQRWLAKRFGPGPHRECDLPPDTANKLPDEAKRLLRLT